MNRVFSIITICIALSVATKAQDLGSSNRLFGGAKPAASNKNPTARPTTRASSRPQPKGSANSNKRKGTVTAVRPAPKPTGKIKRPAAAVKPATDIRNEARDREYDELLAAAQAAIDSSDLAAAELSLTNAQRVKAGDARAFKSLGSLLLGQQRWAEAEEAFRAAIKLSPTDVSAKLALCKLLLRPLPVAGLGERYEEARKMAASAVEAEPNSSAAHDQLAAALEILGLVGPATEREYRRAIELDNSNYLAFAHLGRMMKQSGKQRESASFYGDAITRAIDPVALVAVAEVLQSELRFAESLQLLRRAASNSPKNVAGLNLLGKALLATGDLAEAESVLKRSITTAPRGHVPYLLLADLFLRKGELRMAENYLQQGSRYAFNYDRIAFAERFERIADQYSGRGVLTEADRCYRNALTFEPDRESVLSKLAKRK